MFYYITIEEKRDLEEKIMKILVRKLVSIYAKKFSYT